MKYYKCQKCLLQPVKKRIKLIGTIKLDEIIGIATIFMLHNLT